jgi:hypothetical protein
MIMPIPDYDKYMAGPGPERKGWLPKKWLMEEDEDQIRENERLREETPFWEEEDDKADSQIAEKQGLETD